MTDRPDERPPRPDALLPILGPLDGARIAGGCDYCDAYQVAHQDAPYSWRVTVYHDDGCPRLAERGSR